MFLVLDVIPVGGGCRYMRRERWRGGSVRVGANGGVIVKGK